MTPAELVRILEKGRFDLSSESMVQADIATLLATDLAPGTFSREHVLGPRDRPDFFILPGIVLEVKVTGARKVAVFKQLERYATYREVTAIVLATSLSMGLPAEIGGKPAYYVSLGRAWL